MWNDFDYVAEIIIKFVASASKDDFTVKGLDAKNRVLILYYGSRLPTPEFATFYPRNVFRPGDLPRLVWTNDEDWLAFAEHPTDKIPYGPVQSIVDSQQTIGLTGHFSIPNRPSGLTV
jgi:hypothetical protein